MSGKQTAVEWLSKRLHNRRNGIYDGHPDLSVQQLCEIALIMEREQIMQSYSDGLGNGMHYERGDAARTVLDEKRYYENTFGKEAQP